MKTPAPWWRVPWVKAFALWADVPARTALRAFLPCASDPELEAPAFLFVALDQIANRWIYGDFRRKRATARSYKSRLKRALEEYPFP